MTLAAIGLQAAWRRVSVSGFVPWLAALRRRRDPVREGHVARLVLAVVLAALALVARRRGRTERWLAMSACWIGALLASTPALAGHAQVEGALAVLSDAVHVEAAALWAGGLAVLLLLLRWTSERRWEVAAIAVPAFSSVAVVAVAALLVAGVVNGLFEVGSLAGLWETTYGRLLLVKVALVVPLLALAAFNNRVSVPNLRAGTATGDDRRRFMRATATELALLAVVVAVTTLLVAQPPPRAATASRRRVGRRAGRSLVPARFRLEGRRWMRRQAARRTTSIDVPLPGDDRSESRPRSTLRASACS